MQSSVHAAGESIYSCYSSHLHRSQPVDVQIYEGMIVGEHSRDGDLEVNPVREKKLSNMRSTGADEKVFLSPPR